MAHAGNNVCVLHLSRFDTEARAVREEAYRYVRLRLPDRKRPVPWIRVYLRALSNLLRLRRQWGRIDTIHYHTDKSTALLQALSSKFPGLSDAVHIWTNHSSVLLERIRSKNVPAWLRLALSSADAMIAPSPELERLTLATWGRKASVYYIPNGVDLRKFHAPPPYERETWGIPADSCVILCPRRIVPKNGVLVLAKAVPNILAQANSTRCLFIFVGMNSAQQVAPQYAKDVYDSLAQWGDSVRLLDDVPVDSMPGLYRASDIIVIPSLIEAVSLAALEAAACGRPVVASNVGGLPEVVIDERTGLLVEPNDSNALVNGILRLVENPGFRETLGSGGVELAHEYTWGKVATETSRIYQIHLSGKT